MTTMPRRIRQAIRAHRMPVTAVYVPRPISIEAVDELAEFWKKSGYTSQVRLALLFDEIR